MPKGILVVNTQCTEPARDEEFNRWYMHTHIPDLSKSKGFVRARRFRNLTPGVRYKYQVIYEFDSPNLEESYQDLLRLAYLAYKGKRHIDCIGTPTQKEGERPAQGGLWQEIEAKEYKPLEGHDYSTTALPHIFDAIEKNLRAQGKL